MTRNKYPEQTVERILTVSARLFAEKGYEKTTMQDILDELRLSKGAIYHHFKSKEEILEVVMEHLSQREVALVREIAARAQGANAREKARNLLAQYLVSIGDTLSEGSDMMARLQAQSPRFILLGIYTAMEEIAPIFGRLFEEGIKDGSLPMEYPLEIAEIIMLTFSLWTKPHLMGWDEAQALRRIRAVQYAFAHLGADIITDAMGDALMNIYRKLGFFQGSKE